MEHNFTQVAHVVYLCYFASFASKNTLISSSSVIMGYKVCEDFRFVKPIRNELKAHDSQTH